MMRSIVDRMGELALGALILAACGATTTGYRYPDDLYHANYVKRSMAVRHFAVIEDSSQLPDAFVLLMDQEGQIRATAHRAIVALTPGGEDFGYRPYLSEQVRAGIVARWEAWWVGRSRGTTEEARGA